MAKKIVRSDEKKSIFGLDVNGPVFFTSALLAIISIALTLIYKKESKTYFTEIQNFIADKAGWLFILSVNIFVIFVLYVAFSRFGKMRLGGKNAKPEFSTLAWFSMLFSAGMGIGLLFWSIAEPVTFLEKPPLQESGSVLAARDAMKFTFLHWGLHAWGIYALVGLSLAYFTYSRGLPLTIRSVFYPFLGDRIYGRIGDIIDIFAVLATLFGLATSLGLGVKQVAAGLNHVFGISDGIYTQVYLIIGITIVATISVVTGVDKGVKFLSEMNMRIALLLLGLVFILGPTIFILKSFIQNTGEYVGSIVDLATWTDSYLGTDWQNSWTIFYWGWWIAWSPFVGMFIARVSKGRTIKEFVLGVLIVPTVLTFFWITAFGGTSLHEILGGDSTIAQAVDNNVATALFTFLENFPLSTFLNIVAIILIISFFVTSSDSGSLVVDSLTSGGKIDAPVGQRIFWALAEGAVAAVLLIGGGLQALQTASIATALPFTIILLIMCYSLYKGLNQDYTAQQKKKKLREKEEYEETLKQIIEDNNTDNNFTK